jgi:hypothetical protein
MSHARKKERHDGDLYVIYTSEKKHSVMTIIPVKSLDVK